MLISTISTESQYQPNQDVYEVLASICGLESMGKSDIQNNVETDDIEKRVSIYCKVLRSDGGKRKFLTIFRNGTVVGPSNLVMSILLMS